MSRLATQRSGSFWRYNVWDRFSDTIIFTENGFKTQEEARKARSVMLRKLEALRTGGKPVRFKPNPSKDKTQAHYFGRMNFGRGESFK